MTDDALVLVDRPDDGVAVVTLNRPKALNALSRALIDALVSTLQALDRDDDVRAIVIRGSGERAFAAGADIREMASQTAVSLTKSNAFARWDEVARIRTPDHRRGPRLRAGRRLRARDGVRHDRRRRRRAVRAARDQARRDPRRRAARSG